MFAQVHICIESRFAQDAVSFLKLLEGTAPLTPFSNLAMAEFGGD